MFFFVEDLEPIHVHAPSALDPRETAAHDAKLRREGVIVHRGPPLHPDDTAVVSGVPCTSVERTLIDLADDMPADELRECFRRAVEMGVYDGDRFDASLSRVEWRPSLAIVAEIAEEFR